MKKKSLLDSPRLFELKKRRRRIFQNKILLSTLALLIIFAGLAYISRLAELNISSIEISGNKITNAQMLESFVQQEISGDYLWVFPKANVFLYPKNKIKNDLATQFARLKDISMSVKNNKILEISVTEREPKYLWCGTQPPQTEEVGQCYFLDQSGFIFDQAPYFSGEVYFKFYGQTGSGNGVPSGSYFSQSNFENLVSFKETLEKIGLKPVALYVQDTGDIKIFLSGKTLSTNPAIIFKADADFQAIAENLEAALTTEPLQSEFKNKYSSLLYIDLRYGNKVYYKFSAPSGSALSGQ